MKSTGLRPYVPPTGDEPLDAIEQALAEMFIAILLEEIRAEQRTEAEGDDHRPDVDAADHADDDRAPKS